MWPLIIFIFAIPFRLFFLNLIEFKADEALTLFTASQFFQNFNLPQVGLISSVGMHNFPLFSYLMIIFSFISHDPRFVSFVIALINCIAIALFFMIVRKYYGFLVAIISSLSLAFSPWSILFSRKIWAQDLLLPFSVALIYFINKKNSFYIFLLLTLITQLHGSGIFLFIAVIISMLILRIKIDFNNAFYGILLGLLPALPYFYYQLTANNFCPDCTAFFAFQKISKGFDVMNLLRPLQVVSGLFFQFEAGKEFTFSLEKIFYLHWLFILTGIIYGFINKRKTLFYSLLVLLVPLLYLITKTTSYPHYYAALLPFVCLIEGLGFNYFFVQSNKFFKVGITLFFSVLIIVNILFEITFYRYLSIYKIGKGDYGPIFSQTEEFVNKQIYGYQLLPYYDELKSYSYIFAQSPDFHKKLGEYFSQKNP